MRCMYCNHTDSKVVDSRPTEDGTAIRRRRECTGCAAVSRPTKKLTIPDYGYKRTVDASLLTVKKSATALSRLVRNDRYPCQP